MNGQEIIQWASDQAPLERGTWVGNVLTDVTTMCAPLTDVDEQGYGHYRYTFEEQMKTRDFDLWTLLGRASLTHTFIDTCLMLGITAPHPFEIIQTFFVGSPQDVNMRYGRRLLTRTKIRDKQVSRYLKNFADSGINPALTEANVWQALEGFHAHLYLDHPRSLQVDLNHFSQLLANIDAGAAYVFGVLPGIHVPKELAGIVINSLYVRIAENLHEYFSSFAQTNHHPNLIDL